MHAWTEWSRPARHPQPRGHPQTPRNRLDHRRRLTISPDYDEEQFAKLANYLVENPIDLPIFWVPTPPRNPCRQMREQILIQDLDTIH
jgi:hypothetical protein